MTVANIRIHNGNVRRHVSMDTSGSMDLGMHLGLEVKGLTC